MDCLPISSLDIHQSLLLNGNHTPAKSLEKEQQTDGFPICTCGKEMSGCLIHPNTPDEWIAFMRVSLAKILASPEIRQGLAKKREAVYTVKSSASLGWFDPNTSTWKTSQQSFLTDSEQSLPIWPRSGMTRNGYVFELPIVARRTIGIGGGVWPTPDTRGFVNEGSLSMLGKMCESIEEMNSMAYRAAASKKAKHFPTPTVTSGAQVAWDKTPGQTGCTTLAGFVKYWPTPNATDCRDRGNLSMPSVRRRVEIGKQLNLSMVVSRDSGALSPAWVEWLMGWPIGFTVSRHWATGKSRSKRRSPSSS